jgi:eukaryotic-like serine/threonine-protein kinase
VPDEAIAGRYRLLERLGTGAMAQIWLARDLELDRAVAIKILRPDADRARFRREARAVAGLSHPNVCRLYDFGETDEGPFMVLEYLAGGSLAARIERGTPLPDDETRRIAVDVAAGLAHAHDNGLVHRDLKPANVLFDEEGRAKIADFGIVRAAGTDELTETGAVLGTATYISPEQAGGEPATPASDVYSFGVVLFELLTGRPPFESESAIDVARRHRTEPAPPVSELRPDAPPELAGLAGAALSKDPAARPPDGDALVAALAGERTTGAIPPLPLEGPPTLVMPRARPPRRSRRWIAAAGLALLLLLGAGLALALIATGGSGDDVETLPTLSPPTATSGTSTTEPTTTAEETTEPSTSTEETTEPTTTRPTTTKPTTTATTAAPTTTQPTTTQPATTTEPTTTEPTTTEPTTTAGTLNP